MRLLLKKGEVQQHSRNLDINEVVQDVLKLMRNDLANQSVTVETELAENLPPFRATRCSFSRFCLISCLMLATR